jgi:cytochrome c oxidase assembly protein subunit 11
MLTRDAVVASICGFVVVLMVGASYAAVPFYNWFCRTTGFNGTTQVATSAPTEAPLERTITVSFDSNVAPGLPWKFEPEQNNIDVKIGQVVTVYYTVTNQSAPTSRRSTASASPNRPWRRAKSARWPSCSMSIPRWPGTARTTR